jgi:hypothetical protein
VFAENYLDAQQMARNGLDTAACSGVPVIDRGIYIASNIAYPYAKQELGNNQPTVTLNKWSVFAQIDITFRSGSYQCAWASSSGNNGIKFGIDNTASTTAKKLWFWLDNNNYVSTATTTTTKGWIGVTWASSTAKFWVDGVQLGSNVAVAASLANRYLYDHYPANDPAGNYLNGWLRKLRVFREELKYLGPGCYA